MIYELRLYSVAPGRLADNLSRFRNHLPALFERHGVNCVGYWPVTSGPRGPHFVYMMAYRDYAEREAVWASFYTDDDWWRMRAQTNGAFEMVDRFDLFFLKPNPAWKTPETFRAEGRVVEMILQQVTTGQTAAVNEFLALTWLPLLQEAGAKVAAVMDFASGNDMPRMAIFLAWPDESVRRKGWQSIDDGGKLAAHYLRQRETLGGRTLLTRNDTYLLAQ